MAAVVGVFVMCWTPGYVQVLASVISHNALTDWPLYDAIVAISACFNALLNPLLFVAMDGSFQRALLSAGCAKCACSSFCCCARSDKNANAHLMSTNNSVIHVRLRGQTNDVTVNKQGQQWESEGERSRASAVGKSQTVAARSHAKRGTVEHEPHELKRDAFTNGEPTKSVNADVPLQIVTLPNKPDTDLETVPRPKTDTLAQTASTS